MSTVATRGRTTTLTMAVGADLPDLRQVVGASVRQPEEDRRTVYFDTADARLWQRGVTLDHRTGDDAPGWVLERPRPAADPVSLLSEGEVAGDAGRVPQPILDGVAGLVRREPLHQVAELRTERISFLLRDDAGTWAELASEVATVVGGPRDGQRYRQLALTVTAGDSDRSGPTRAVLAALRAAGARPDRASTAERVLGPRTGLAPLGKKSTAEDLIRHAVTSGLGRLLDHELAIRVAGPGMDPEDVHQARVASRRLRSDLDTLRPLLDPVWTDHVRHDLRVVGAALGAVRDADVLAVRLRRAGASGRLRRLVDEDRGAAVAALLAAVEEPAHLDLLDRLHAACARPPVADRRRAGRAARHVLPPLLRRRWTRVRREVRRAGRRPSNGRLHEIRKKTKQLRYASELAAPVTGKAARRTATASAALQTTLGKHHDAVVARRWLTRAAAAAMVDVASDVAPLVTREDRRRARLAHRWRPRYRRLAAQARRI